MAKTIIEQKFPCGYELKIEHEGWGDVNFPVMGICPLHNKKCKSKYSKMEKKQK